MKDVQCYELFGGIALKNHAFSFSFVLFPQEMFYVCTIFHSKFPVVFTQSLRVNGHINNDKNEFTTIESLSSYSCSAVMSKKNAVKTVLIYTWM